MTITTLDELIARLQQSREAAGSNLPVRLKLTMNRQGDDCSPDATIVNTHGLLVMQCIGESGMFVQLAAVGRTT